MKTPAQQFRTTIMWYKVKELYSEGLNKSQISLALGIDRGTVRKYLEMSERDFMHWISKPHRRPKKLQAYVTYIKEQLEEHPYLSCAQIEDRLKEYFPEAPVVSSKTVYNTVETIRKEYGLSKRQNDNHRIYHKRIEEAYGAEAQVDFGSYNMIMPSGKGTKVYFFVMLLSRSRHKFVLFQDYPFTTQTTIDAHNEAFNYFTGQPRRILYDQDRVLMKEENLGDLILVQEFQRYITTMKFRPVFCRKSDPESKGKVENVVGYIKNNFLKGREYHDITTLNQAALAWLDRTANGTKHAGTQKIPYREWLEERNHLLPYYHHSKPAVELLPYKVRKDNTINYKGNFYTLPLVTYRDATTTVLVKVEENTLYILSDAKERELLTTHTLSYGRGQTIRNTNHSRDKSKSLDALKQEVAHMYSDVPSYEDYISLISKDKVRYLRDNLLQLKSGRNSLDAKVIEEAILFCIEQTTYNAHTMLQVARSYKQQKETDNGFTSLSIHPFKGSSLHTSCTPKRSKISTYEEIIS